MLESCLLQPCFHVAGQGPQLLRRLGRDRLEPPLRARGDQAEETTIEAVNKWVEYGESKRVWLKEVPTI